MASDYREIAGFYDHEYPDVDYLGPDVACFLDHVPGERVLELGCGTGRAAVAMAAAGRQVTGVDVDQNVLDIANAKGGDARYVQADLSEPDWQSVVDGPFDAACCFFNTFLAMADPEAQEHCLRGCHELLAPDGLLWLDVFHPNLDLITNAVGGATELEPVLFSLPDGRGVMRTTSLYADITRQTQHVTFHYAWHNNGRRHEQTRSFDMTWIMPREMERLLRLCGFQLVDTFGDHDGSDLDDDSERQIVLARRI